MSFLLIHVNSITAALANFDLGVPIGDLIKAIQDKEEERIVKLATAQHCLTSLPNQPVGIDLNPVATFFPNPTEPLDPDQRAKEYMESLKQAHLRKDVATNKLPT